MKRSSLIPLLIAAFSIIMIVVGFFVYRGSDLSHTQDLSRITGAKSVIELSMTLHYDKPPIYEEQYLLRDISGVSSATYTIHAYNGKLVTIEAPPDRNYNVSFFFDRVVQDGIWDVVNAPPRGNTSIHYTLYVHQQIEGKQGSRTVLFTDPHYLAIQAGHQYAIRLDPKKPVPDLLHLHGTSVADPRYQRLVNDFRNFGPPSFRRKVAQAQALVRAGT